MEVNSYTITGKASPHSVIRFSGDPAIPDGEIQSPNFSETDKYHVTADENGDYLYELPKDSLFTEGNEVTAYAYLNGKSATASTVVCFSIHIWRTSDIYANEAVLCATATPVKF